MLSGKKRRCPTAPASPPNCPSNRGRPIPTPSAPILTAACENPRSLRRHFDSPRFLTDLLHSSALEKEAARLKEVPLANFLSALAEEMRCGRNRRAVLTFVERVLLERRSWKGPDGCGRDERRGNSEGSNGEVGEGGQGGGWVDCVAFMMSFDALVDSKRLLQKPQKQREGSEDDDHCCRDNGGYDDGEVIDAALCVIRIVRGTNKDESSSNSVVERCFKDQLAKLDVYLQAKKNHHLVNCDAPTMSQSKLRTESFGSLSSCEEELDCEDNAPVPLSLNKPSASREYGGKRNESLCEQEDYRPATVEVAGRKLSAPEKEPQCDEHTSREDTKVVIAEEEKPKLCSLEQMATELRPSLVRLTTGSTSSEVQSVSDRINNLVQRAGKEDGADGVARVGSILSYGMEDSGGDDEKASATPNHTQTPTSFTDVLVSSLLNTCLTESTSALRATAFIRSFLLPLTLELDDAPASRVLMSTVMSVVRDRPVEAVEALLIPTLLRGKVKSDDQRSTPSPVQCELVSRIIKIKVLPGDCVSLLLTGLLGPRPMGERGTSLGLAWTDQTLPVVTSCLNQRPTLSNDVVMAMSHHIERESCTADQCRSMKFSAMFHAFVTKFGTQIKSVGCIQVLRDSSGRIKTFMGKSILSALKKLK